MFDPRLRSRQHTKALAVCGLICLLATFIALPRCGTCRAQPPTRKDDVKEVVHGVEIVDPYRWLEDQDSPETRDWIRAQNKYTQSILGNITGRDLIRDELAGLMRRDVTGSPTHRRGRYFYTRRRPGHDLDMICMRVGPDGGDRILMDPHCLTDDHSISVSMLGISEDGTLLVYGLRQAAEDEMAVRIMDVNTEDHLKDEFPKGLYSSMRFTPDNLGFYYVRYLPEGERVFYHELGTEQAEDALIFGETYGSQMGIDADLSRDGRYLLLTVYHGSAARRSEIHLIDLEAGGKPKTVVDDVDSRFTPRLGGDKIFISTIWNAPNGRILSVDIDDPDIENWKEIIPETDAALSSFTLAGGRIMVRYLENVIPRIQIFEADGEPVSTVEIPAIGYLGRPRGRWQDNEAFFTFSSYHIPPTIYRYDLQSLIRTVWAEEKAPIHSEVFTVEQVWFESHDGTMVPMFLAHLDGIELDGTNPTLLTGYGGFNSSVMPYFSERGAYWMLQGGVYAAPNLRGGGEFGDGWHRAGMLEKKQNTFDDFVAAAEWLIENGYTQPDKLAIRGGSNGGLLVGAALTQRPDLFKAVVCTYPLLDMVRYHRFLVAHWWVAEYGSSDNPEQFEYLHAYSPYHNVEPGVEYPAVLFVTGDSDTRVAPLHARKMTALLQSSTGSDNPVLLHYDTAAGHSRGRPLTEIIEDQADQMAFLMWQLGIEP
jgi:prolyl oligopeptidase